MGPRPAQLPPSLVVGPLTVNAGSASTSHPKCPADGLSAQGKELAPCKEGCLAPSCPSLGVGVDSSGESKDGEGISRSPGTHPSLDLRALNLKAPRDCFYSVHTPFVLSFIQQTLTRSPVVAQQSHTQLLSMKTGV